MRLGGGKRNKQTNKKTFGKNTVQHKLEYLSPELSKPRKIPNYKREETQKCG